jgi:predicted dehydrogenase
VADEVRIGIVGVGQIGKAHLQQYAAIEGVRVVAVCDVDEAEAHRVAERFGVPSVYADFRELLRREDIVAVDVCLHNNLHAPVAIAALEAGKHVYCEKPMAGSYADARAMLDAARAHGRMLHIQLAQLYTRETKVAKHLIDAGRLGRPYYARSTGHRRRGRPFVDGYGSRFFVSRATAGGGALLDMGVYHISQILYLLGTPEAQRIVGRTYQELDMDPVRQAESGYDVEELALGFVQLAGGITLEIAEAWAIHLGSFEGSYVVGSQGGIRLNPFAFYTTLDDVPFDLTTDLAEVDTRWHRLRFQEDAYDSSQRHWVAALAGRVPLLPTAEVALETMLVSEGIYLSARLGREVTRQEVVAHSKPTALAV